MRGALTVAVAEPPPERADPVPVPAAEEKTPEEGVAVVPAAPSSSVPNLSLGTWLLPPMALVWSPRKDYRVTTSLSAKEIAQVFEGQLTARPGFLRRLRSYHRKVRWDVQRNAMSGQVIATCVPTDLVRVGWGKYRMHVDVSGDTFVLHTEEGPEGRTVATVGCGRYTRWWFFYMFPDPILSYDVVKAIKKRDRAAYISYPWSWFRIALVALVLLWVLVGSVSSGASSSGSASSGGGGGAAVVAAAPDATTSTSVDPGTSDGYDGTDTTETTDTTASALPDEPADQMREEITDLLRTWHQAIVDGDPQAAWDLLTTRKQQQSERKYGFDEWARNQDTLRAHLDPSGIRVAIRDTDPRTGVVTVDVRGMRWHKAGSSCSTWSGLTWVRYENGSWRYDPGYSTTSQREREWKARFSELLGGSC